MQSRVSFHFISLRASITSFFVSFHLDFVPHRIQYILFFHSNFYPSSFITPCNIIFIFIICILRPLVFLFPSLPFVNKITIEIKFDLPCVLVRHMTALTASVAAVSSTSMIVASSTRTRATLTTVCHRKTICLPIVSATWMSYPGHTLFLTFLSFSWLTPASK